jgi:hypothetical protein
MRSLSNIEWRALEDGLIPFDATTGDRITWAPQPGSQVEALACPLFEMLYEGTRGPGKTDTLLMMFFQYVGVGFGAEWRGVIFRRTYPELQDLIEKSLKWFKLICPAATYNASEHVWTFPDGEKLYLRHFLKDSDYWKYHGHAYPFIAWEELCTWPSDSGYKMMMSCCRSSKPGIPLMYRSTANPYGPGHNWVKSRFQLPIAGRSKMIGPVIREEGQARCAIHGELRENKVLLYAQPDYPQKLKLAARNDAELKAWLHGDWNIVAGGMFDDVWNDDYNVLPNFPINLVPRSWRMSRSYDHGSSKPFSVGWWAESDGTRFEWNGHIYGPVRGDLIRVAEWYGCSGKPNEGLRMTGWNIGRGILEQEVEWEINGRVYRGPADDSIFDPYDGQKSIAGDMAKSTNNLVLWNKAFKTPGSRVRGWDAMRKLLQHAHQNPDGPREEPGLFVLERCDDFRRTVPVLSRADKNLDDIDTEAEDHIADEVRYKIMERKVAIQSGSWK